MAEANDSVRVSRVSCCVVGCHNTYANTSKQVKFYRFPNKPYEQLRRKVWINSVHREYVIKSCKLLYGNNHKFV